MNKFVQQFFIDITSLGSLVFFCVLLALALVFQEFLLFFKLLFGLIFTLVLVVLTRMFYFKNRPKKQDHHNFFEKIDASSFPSLHTARVVFLAALFIHFFSGTAATILFIALAILISYSRIYLQKHDWYDLFGGLVLGLITFWITLIF